MSKHTPGPWYFKEYHGGNTDEMIALGIAPVPCLSNSGERYIMSETGRVALVDCQSPYKRGHGHQTECAERDANARLIAAAPTQHEEMLRYLPIIERAESDPELWERLTAGTGIATANGYRAAIAKATGGEG